VNLKLKLRPVRSRKSAIPNLKSPRWKKGILPLLGALLSLQAPIYGVPQSAKTYSSIGLALQAIRQTFNVSTGIEHPIGDADESAVTLDLAGKDVSRVFDDLVAQRPAYVWNFKDGVYNVYPKMKVDSLSQLTVRNYVLTDATLEEAKEALVNLTEVKKWLSQRRATANWPGAVSVLGPGPGGPFRRLEPVKTSLALNKVPFRMVLNQLTSRFGGMQWNIWHQGRNGQFIHIYISP